MIFALSFNNVSRKLHNHKRRIGSNALAEINSSDASLSLSIKITTKVVYPFTILHIPKHRVA